MLNNIQYLRGIAALLVAVGHTLHQLLERSSIGANPTLMHLVDSGAAGVDIFFVISGFIMFHVSRKDAGGPADARRFLLRRVVRVFPLYWIVSTVVVVFYFSGIPNSKTNLNPDYLFFSYLLVPVSDLNGVIGPVLNVGWTLVFEMFFYVCVGLALFLPEKLRAVSISGGMLLLVGLGVLLPSLRESNIVFETYTSTLLIEFLMGAWIALLFHSALRVPRWLSAPLVIAGFVLLVVLYSGGLYERWLTSGLPAAAIVFGAVMLHKAEDRPARTIAPLKLLGDASYSLYLTHAVLLFVVSYASGRVPDSQPLVFALLAIGAIAAEIACAVVAFRLIERPLSRSLNRRLIARG